MRPVAPCWQRTVNMACCDVLQQQLCGRCRTFIVLNHDHLVCTRTATLQAVFPCPPSFQLQSGTLFIVKPQSGLGRVHATRGASKTMPANTNGRVPMTALTVPVSIFDDARRTHSCACHTGWLQGPFVLASCRRVHAFVGHTSYKSGGWASDLITLGQRKVIFWREVTHGHLVRPDEGAIPIGAVKVSFALHRTVVLAMWLVVLHSDPEALGQPLAWPHMPVQVHDLVSRWEWQGHNIFWIAQDVSCLACKMRHMSCTMRTDTEPVSVSCVSCWSPSPTSCAYSLAQQPCALWLTTESPATEDECRRGMSQSCSCKLRARQITGLAHTLQCHACRPGAPRSAGRPACPVPPPGS